MNMPLTPPEHQHSEIVVEAAKWLGGQPEPPKPLVPELMKRFPLTVLEACEAAGLAHLYRVRKGMSA